MLFRSIGSDTAQLLARPFMGYPLGMHPPVPGMEIGENIIQPLPSTHSSLATDLKRSKSQVILSRRTLCVPSEPAVLAVWSVPSGLLDFHPCVPLGSIQRGVVGDASPGTTKPFFANAAEMKAQVLSTKTLACLSPFCCCWLASLLLPVSCDLRSPSCSVHPL